MEIRFCFGSSLRILIRKSSFEAGTCRAMARSRRVPTGVLLEIAATVAVAAVEGDAVRAGSLPWLCPPGDRVSSRPGVLCLGLPLSSA